MDPKEHWEAIYQRKRPDEVSWFQPAATLSLRLIHSAAPASARVLDVGGGASTLVDGLLQSGFRDVTVLDLSESALLQSQDRLGPNARLVSWIQGDILSVSLADRSVDVWHDRAVFHFLTGRDQRDAYIRQVKRIVRPHGLVLVATFAEDGPTKCSGLPVEQYSAQRLHGTFGSEFVLLASEREEHITPQGMAQAFTYCLCRYEPARSRRPAA